MARPKVLEELDKKVSATEEEEFDSTLPVDADTLGGYPPDHYASTTYVAQTISDYLKAILGRSY